VEVGAVEAALLDVWPDVVGLECVCEVELLERRWLPMPPY